MAHVLRVFSWLLLLPAGAALKAGDDEMAAIITARGSHGGRLIRDANVVHRYPRSSPATAAVQIDAKGSVVRSTRGKLKVAYAVFVTDIVSRPWADALRVLAYSVHKAAAKSRHSIELLALSPEALNMDVEKQLVEFGFAKVLRKPVPVDPDSVKQKMAQEHMQRVQGGHGGKGFNFTQADETIKYWGLTLTDYDRVLVLDADTMILDPMDELLELAEDFAGVRDHGLDVEFSTMPPTQGGFLLFRPNMTDFHTIVNLTTEGDWSGNGWKDSGIGWCYGGVGPDGLLTYHFNAGALPLPSAQHKASLPEGLDQAPLPGSRMKAVDRAIYDLVVNDRLMRELEGHNHTEAIGAVKSVHFTGNCVKPWTCAGSRDWLCEPMVQRWWALRAELEASLSLPPTPRKCVHDEYTPLATAA